MKIPKIIAILCLSGFICSDLFAYTERNLLQAKAPAEKIASMLVENEAWIPYPAYADRAGWDKLMGSYRADFIRKGEQFLTYQWQVINASAYLEYERSGNRNIMQDPNSANNNALSALMMAELAEGKGRFMDQIINGVFSSCEKTSWVLSAHLSAQHSKRAFPEHDDQVIDLGSGEMGAMLSWAHYFFAPEFDKIAPQIASRLRYEIKRRILDPYLQEDRFWWMAVNYKPGMMVNNWNPWCNFNVLQCFLLMETDKNRLSQAVNKSIVSVDKFINYTHADGACEEGPSYWGHAAGKMYDYLQLLSDATNGSVSLFNESMVRNMGEYIVRSYIGDGWVVNFADASAKGGGNAPLIYRYGNAVKSELMKKYAAYLQSQQLEKDIVKTYTSFGTDIYRGLQTLLYKDQLNETDMALKFPAYSWYPETQFCYMTGKSGSFFAAKGGYNNESHNHNDAGTFSYYINNIPFIIDAGVGTYTRQTFSGERYSIWTMQSNYHNLPMINGVAQKFGAQYKATDVRFDAKKMHFSANIATAYPAEANVKTWVRSYRVKSKSLQIEDRFALNVTNKPNQINFLVWGDVDITNPGKITLAVKGETAALSYDAKQFIPSIETIKLDDPRLSSVWGEQIYRISLTEKQSVLSGNYVYTITHN